MEFSKAKTVAGHIVDVLQPMCKLIAVAGSIRRQRPEVNDIDLVILTDDREAVKRRCQQRCAIVSDGLQNAIFRLSSGLQLDLFFTRGPVEDLLAPWPSNWGTVLLQRTGSKEHNIYLCQRAISFGLKWDPQEGVKDPEGYVIAAETEKEVYDALALPVILPFQREIGYLLEHFGPDDRRRQPAAESTPPTAPERPKSDPEAAAKALADFHNLGQLLKSEN